MISQTEENYLKALVALANGAGEVNVNDLSRRLGIKMPTVTSMMQKLARKKYVHYQRYRPLRLTDAGRTEALLILRRHRLTEMFLAEKMHFHWDEVHEIAEQIEHVRAPLLFDRMDELLGFPAIDPHGEPIPAKDGAMAPLRQFLLTECAPGDTVTLAAVADATDDLLKSLDSLSIRLGLRLRVRSFNPFDSSMRVSYGKNRTETLSRAICERLLVAKR